MAVSILKPHDLALPRRLGAVIAAAGMVSLLATYWDDAWHTDRGRDAATIPPHLLLYSAVAVAGLAVAGWGLLVLARARSLRATARYRPLLLAGLGGLATLGAAPIDAAWHTAYGRDAVLWSPPHMLVVFASTAMVAGVLAGMRPGPGAAVETATVVVLLGSAVASVIEYETDVPQFGEVWYLPVLLAAVLFAAAVARGLVPGRFPVTAMVAGYVVLRLVVIGVLASLGRSTPDLPIAVLGLVLVDLPWRGWPARYAVGAAVVAGLAWLASATGLASQPPVAVARVALPVILVALAVIAVAGLPVRRTTAAAVLAVALGAGLAVTPARPAVAHDPGQGRDVMTVQLSGSSDGHGGFTLTADPTDCRGLTPSRVVARRAGHQVTGPLRWLGVCRYQGDVTVPEAGRWFVYLQFVSLPGSPATGGSPTPEPQPDDGGQTVEVWLPLVADRGGAVTETRILYRPAGEGPGSRDVQAVTGVLIYAVGVTLIGLAAWQLRRAARAKACSVHRARLTAR